VAGVASVELTNLDETIAAFGGFSTDAVKTLNEGLKAAAGVIVTEAQSIAPKRTGNMARSVKPVGGSGVDTSISVVGGGDQAPYLLNFHEAAIRGSGSSIYYWFKLRTPTGVHPIIRRLPNEPFMLMAFDRKIDQAAELMVATVDAALAEFGD